MVTSRAVLACARGRLGAKPVGLYCKQPSRWSSTGTVRRTTRSDTLLLHAATVASTPNVDGCAQLLSGTRPANLFE